MQRTTPSLWFDGQAEEAANFYISVFDHSRVTAITRYGEGAPFPKGTALTVGFELDGQDYVALNGGPHFSFTPAISFVVNCASQQEVDRYWERLGAGGAYQQCGWLQDRYGVSWQIVPRVLPQLLAGADAAGAQRAMSAMLGMKKLDIAALQRAYAGR
ncbi:VOC family protein [Variovorax terrae]|uniref:VOC family protein n=1 Tax=Variovorax terrae TaxID=2923278 RepID=A0A9X1VWL8_9BURK|nr:VOC family protein [Variovorax terrae]MCJ0761903.1 VOC family protein [Variovorax terrae]